MTSNSLLIARSVPRRSRRGVGVVVVAVLLLGACGVADVDVEAESKLGSRSNSLDAKSLRCAEVRASALEQLSALQQEAQTLAASDKSGDTDAPMRFVLGPYGVVQSISGRLFRLKPPTTLAPQATAGEAALALAKQHAALFGLGVDDKLVVASERATKGGSYVRLKQLHGGVPVWGAQLALEMSSDHAVVSLFSSLVPNIARSSVATLAASDAQALIAAKQPGALIISGNAPKLYFRPEKALCDAAHLAWKLGYMDSGEPRQAWVDAHNAAVLGDYSRGASVVKKEVKRYICPTTAVEVLRSCVDYSPCDGLTGDALSVCVWMQELADYWADNSLHGATARDSYDDQGSCMKTLLKCSGTSGWPGGSEPVGMTPDYMTRSVLAHEFGHVMIPSADVPVDLLNEETMEISTQDRPVFEHIADMHAMALESTEWTLKRTDGSVIRNWQNPPSVSGYGTLLTRFPIDFNEYNEDSKDGNRSGVYISWHVLSTIWSHLNYQLAQKPGMNRSSALEVVYRTLTNRLRTDNDFSFTGFSYHLKAEANTMGYGSAVGQAHEEASFWQPAEILLSNVDGRPGLVAGYDSLWVPWWPYRISWATLRAYYKRAAFRQTPTLNVATYDASLGTWTTTNTGLSPSTVAGAITAAYFGDYEMIAWRTYSNTVNYAIRSTWIGNQWSTIVSIPGVSTTADVSLAAGSDGFRLFYRDASTSRLRYVRYSSGTWFSPVVPPGAYNIVMSSGPSATWENGRYHIAALVNSLSTTMQITQGTPDYWQNLRTHDDCFFSDSSAAHVWSDRQGIAVYGNDLHVLGAVDGGLHQGYAKRSSAGAYWALEAHGGIEQYGTAADLEVFGDRIWAVGYNGWPSRTASLFWKRP